MYVNGKIEKVWDNSYKCFVYTKQSVMQSEIDYWVSLGYYHNNYTGSMYDNQNPMPIWVNDVGKNFRLKDKTYTFYRMDTLEIMPAHVDHFSKYRELFCKDITKIKRAIVFLEDWKPGHYFEVNKSGYVNWQAGNYILWDYNIEHAASNIGVEPRYTLQITGHV